MRQQQRSHAQESIPKLTKPIYSVSRQCNDLLIVGKKTVNIGTPLEKLEPYAYYFDSGDSNSMREMGLFCAEIPSKV